MASIHKLIDATAVTHPVSRSSLDLKGSSLRPTGKFARLNVPPMTIEMPAIARSVEESSPPTQDNCDGRKEDMDSTITISSAARMASETVAPFLTKHIPEQYNPLGIQGKATISSQQNPNTKFCYRHRPDSKCRRTANEPSMENLQRVSSTARVFLYH